MRIAISGASGTGKTTLAKAIAAHYGIPINPIGSRDVAVAMGFRNPYDVDAAGKRSEFQRELFHQKRQWELDHEHFVTDRSVYDNLTYTALHAPASVTELEISAYKIAATRYDMTFLLDYRHFQRLDDGVRIQNKGYHAIYHQLLRSFYPDHQRTPSFAVIHGDDPLARFAVARLYIQNSLPSEILP